MAIQINTYHLADLACLFNDWKRLERGPEMTYFQTWEWNKMLLCALPRDSAHFELIFLDIQRDGITEMIIPLWIIKKRYRWVHRPMITLLGQGGWSDYLNAIYSDFSEELMDAVMDYLRINYPSIPLCLSSLKEDCSFYNYLVQRFRINHDITGNCVSVILPQTVEQWQKSLSKSTRQNLRTAINRMERDGISYTVNIDDTMVDKEACVANRARRSQMKAVRDEHLTWTKQLKRWVKYVFCRLPVKGSYLPIIDDPKAKIMTISTTDGHMMAYFHYGYDDVHREIVVISAGVMEEYERYSPGMVLMKAYIEYAIEEKMVDIIDFTRGDEPYKLALGGIRKLNHTIQLTI